MWNPKEDKALINAISDYVSTNNLILDEKHELTPIIDGVFVEVDGKPVLIVGLPPVSNYNVRETEHTRRYLKAKKTVA